MEGTVSGSRASDLPAFLIRGSSLVRAKLLSLGTPLLCYMVALPEGVRLRRPATQRAQLCTPLRTQRCQQRVGGVISSHGGVHGAAEAPVSFCC